MNHLLLRYWLYWFSTYHGLSSCFNPVKPRMNLWEPRMRRIKRGESDASSFFDAHHLLILNNAPVDIVLLNKLIERRLLFKHCLFLVQFLNASPRIVHKTEFFIVKV